MTRPRRGLTAEERLFLGEIQNSLSLSDREVQVALKKARQSGLAARIAQDYGPVERQIAGSKGNWFTFILCLTVASLILISPDVLYPHSENYWQIGALFTPLLLYVLYISVYVLPKRRSAQDFNLHVAIRYMQETAGNECDEFMRFFDSEHSRFQQFISGIEADLRVIPRVETESEDSVSVLRSEADRLRQEHASLSSIVHDLENKRVQLNLLNQQVMRATDSAISALLLLRTDEVIDRASGIRTQAESTMKDVSESRKSLDALIQDATTRIRSLNESVSKYEQ